MADDPSSPTAAPDGAVPEGASEAPPAATVAATTAPAETPASGAEASKPEAQPAAPAPAAAGSGMAAMAAAAPAPAQAAAAALAPVAAPVAAPAPAPAGAPADEEDERTLMDDLDDLVDRIAGAQGRIKGKSDLFVRKAGGGKLATAVRDALSDEVLQLMGELAKFSAEGASGYDKLVRHVHRLEDEIEDQGRALRDFVSGSVLAYAVILAQMVQARPAVDDEMRRVSQEILDAMGSIQPPPAPDAQATKAPADPPAPPATPEEALPAATTTAPSAP